MKYPSLIPERLCKTDVTMFLEQEGVTEYGEPLPGYKFSGKCNYQDKAKAVYTTEKKLVQITGSVLIPGDICPELAVISAGKAVVHGVERTILRGSKARNPDGTVNFTEVLLV